MFTQLTEPKTDSGEQIVTFSNIKKQDKEIEINSILGSDLPAMPIVAAKVLALIEDERATANDLAKIVSSDPGVASRVLKITNSAYYGCQRQVQTLPRAIAIIGFNTLRSLVLAASVKEVFKPKSLTGKMLWDQSFGAGLAASIIARNTCELNHDEAFLIGLLQDIGKIILNHHDEMKFKLVMEQYYNEMIPFEEAESMFYSFSHAELGGYVLRHWNFPDDIVNSVSLHHSKSFIDIENDYLKKMSSIACLANNFCIKLGIGERAPKPELNLADTTANEILKLSTVQLEDLLDIFYESYQQDKSYFD